MSQCDTARGAGGKSKDIEKIIEQELYGHYLKVQRQLFYSRPQQTSGPEVRIIGEKIDPAPKRADFN